MKKFLVIFYLISLIVNFTSVIILPDQVAIHFSRGGIPDNWSSKYFHCFIFTLVFTGFFLLYYFLPILIFKLSPKYINLPNRNYWFSEKNYQITKQKITNWLHEMGISLFVFFLIVYLLVIKANLSDPVILPEHLFLPIFIIYIIYIVMWIIRFMIFFIRSPQSQS